MEYHWQFSVIWDNLDILIEGMLFSLWLTVCSIIFGYIIGLILFFLKLSNRKILIYLSVTIIEVFRSLPVLVTLVWFYYSLPIFFESFVHLSAFWIAVLGIGLNFGALQAEILRSGYDAIPKGEIESAKYFGFRPIHIAQYIIVPQAFWRSLAPTLGQVINTIKLTSLAAFISVDELFFTTSNLIQSTYRPLELYTALAALYLIIIIPFSLYFQSLEKQLNLRFSNG